MVRPWLPTTPAPLALAQPQAPAPAHPGFAPPPVFAPLNFGVSAEQKLELLELWRSIHKRRWLILGLGLVAAVLAAVVAMALTPIYRSTATVLIEASKGKILSIEDIYAGQQQREHYQTQVEILKSREVAERTVRALKLHEHPDFDPRQAQPGALAGLKATLGIGAVKTEWTEAEAVDAATRALMKQLTVDAVRLSQLVKVSFASPDKELAARVANTLAQQYIDSDRDARFKLSQEVSSFLQERLTTLRENLTRSEQALQAYREQRGIVSVAGSTSTLATQQIGGTSNQLLEARNRRLALESAYQQVNAILDGNFADVPAVMRDPGVADAQRQLADVRRKLAEAATDLGPAHPRVQQLQAEATAVRASLLRQSQLVVASITREYEQARGTEQALERQLGAARGEVQNVNRGEFELAVLERDVATNRQLYDMFFNRAKETNLAGDVQASVARIVDPAIPSVIPFEPKRTQIVLVATVLALFAGALAAMLLDRLDNTIKGGEDAEARLRQPVLTALPVVDGALDRKRSARLFLTDVHSHYAEAIRTARTGVMLSNLDASHKVLMITSSLPGEGKTTVAINLALAHAQTQRTLLVDCDMRRSQVAGALGIPPGGKGLSNLVAGTAVMQECIQEAPGTTLHVLSAGDAPPNPLELLVSKRFKETLEALTREYDIVILDTPPVELVSEALVLAPLATSTLFVVKAMSTPAPLVRKSLTRLQRAGANMLGTVLNQLDFSRARLYYGEYGASSYSYGGYGYGGYIGGKALNDSKGGDAGGDLDDDTDGRGAGKGRAAA